MQPRCLAHTLFIRYEVIAARPSLSPATDQGQSIYPAHSEPDWNTRKHHNKEPDGLKLQLSHREDESDGQKQTCSVSGHLWPETQNGSSEAQQKNLLPTPAQTQKTLADEPGPNLSRHRHVGLPGLCEDPAEWCQEEKVQKGCRHDTDTLWMQEKKKSLSHTFPEMLLTSTNCCQARGFLQTSTHYIGFLLCLEVFLKQ